MIKEFFKPSSPAEAVALKQTHNAEFIAGGTWLNSSYSKLEPEKVVSLAGLKLDFVKKEKGKILIGSAVTMQELIDNKDIPDALKKAASHVGSRNIRNMATVGGSIASSSTWFSLTPVLFALSANLVVHDGKSEKIVSAYDYIKNESKDLITAIEIPENHKAGFSVFRFARTARTVPVVVCSASVEVEGGVLKNPIIAIGGVDKKVIRLEAVEKEISGKEMPALEKLEKMIADKVNPTKDFRGGVEFKKYMAGVLSAQCLNEAFYGASK